EGYPEHYREIADFSSACFQYMLIMSETVYRVPPERQKLFFNEGLHRSMIWVLDKYIRVLRNIPIADGGLFMAPLFENVDLGTREGAYQDSFNKLINGFGAKAIAAAKILAVKHPKLAGTLKELEGYVVLANTLPDVAPYWR